jgi:hypothetical protein
MSNIADLIAKHGKKNIRALIPLKPLHVYGGMIAITSSSDPDIPTLCELDESRYKIEENYKVGWKPIKPFDPKKPESLLHDVVGLASKTFYVSDFDSIVKEGHIKLFVEVA